MSPPRVEEPGLLWVTGGTGLVGQALLRELPGVALRRSPQGGQPWWEPLHGRIHENGENVRAIVALAGASVGEGRWTRARLQELRDSRIRGLETLLAWLARRPQRPEVLVSASAIGYYGDRGDELLTEESRQGEGILAQLCADWEGAAAAIGDLGIRVVCLRFGLVLDARFGALAKMLLPFRAGLGGPLGSGRQYQSWIHLRDAVAVTRRAVEDPGFRGAYNVVSPTPVRQLDFANTLGEVLQRPARLPAPTFALRLALGTDMANELVLASQRVSPLRLQQAGFSWLYPELPEALRQILNP